MSDFNGENWMRKIFREIFPSLQASGWKRKREKKRKILIVKKEEKRNFHVHEKYKARNEKLLPLNWTHEKVCKEKVSI